MQGKQPAQIQQEQFYQKQLKEQEIQQFPQKIEANDHLGVPEVQNEIQIVNDLCCICNQQIQECEFNFKLKLEYMKECENTQKLLHFAHLNCIIITVQKKIAKKSDTFCQKCNMLVSTQDLIIFESQRQNVIRFDKKFYKFQQDFKKFAKKVGSIVREHYQDEIFKTFKQYICKKCQHTSSVQRGEVDYSIKNWNGQLISVDAAINYNLNKIQCESCSYNFCNKCQIEPYHLGYTCEEYYIYLDTRKCRFCKNIIGDDKQQALPWEQAFEEVCNSGSCLQLMNMYCSKFQKDCGHTCYGAKQESNCLPCLNLECVAKQQDLTYGVNAHDFCSICYTDELGQAPSVQLNCKHIFHHECLKKILTQRYQTIRITLGYLDCPICGVQMETTQSQEIIELIRKQKHFKERVYREAQATALREGLYNEEEYKERKEFHTDPIVYAILKLAFYECYKCKNIFCGGHRDCEAEMNEANLPKKEDILCVYCRAQKLGNQFAPCETHGEEFIEHKCQFCCQMATWFCWGAT
eukprot:403352152